MGTEDITETDLSLIVMASQAHFFKDASAETKILIYKSPMVSCSSASHCQLMSPGPCITEWDNMCRPWLCVTILSSRPKPMMNSRAREGLRIFPGQAQCSQESEPTCWVGPDDWKCQEWPRQVYRSSLNFCKQCCPQCNQQPWKWCQPWCDAR